MTNNTSYAPLSGSSGPFTIAFWFRSGDVTPSQSYLLEGYGNGQWSVVYGYNPQQIEFYTGNAAVRQNSGITISDTAWHHIAYRKSASGASSWDKFLDGVKTNISPSIAFSLPAVSSFFAFNADNGLAPCLCSLADVAVYDSALTDAQVQALAAGNHPAPASDLLLYWPLTGTTNPEQDASGNNHPGTVFGNIVQVPDPPYPIATSSTARGATTLSSSNVIKNTSYAPFSGSSGPFTIAFWFQSGDVTPGQSYLLEGYGGGQWSVIYGYNPQQIEFFTGDAAVRQNSGITISDTAWHHIAYRKSASGASSWDKFLDGVKTNISPSIAFSLPAVSSFFAFNADNGLAPCLCSLADVAVYDSALSDAQVQALAAGNHPAPASDLLLYWPLTGTTNPEQDASGNNHPGTVFGNIVQVPGPAFTSASVAISISPTQATLGNGQTQQFTATVTGTTNTAVTWSLQPQVGSVANGLYTAPPSITSNQTVILTATSSADPSKSASASISLTPASTATARGATTLSDSNVIKNTSYAPLSGSSGPFTIAFWFQSGDVTPGQSYLLEGFGSGEWAMIYGYAAQQIEFFTGDAAVRQNSGITISDTAWHHIAYRKSASGASSWDKFLDGVKTNISPSIAFSLPAVSSFFAFNADNGLAPCLCSLADVAVYDSALSDAQVQALAAGNHPAPASDLLLYWPLTGTTNPEQDASGNNHPGTVFGNIVHVPGPAFTGTGTSVTVSISPSQATLSDSQTQQFTATVTGSSNTAVTWSLQPQVGTITTGGLYTAPSTITSNQTVTVTSTSSADVSKTDTSTISLIPPSSTARGTTTLSNFNVVENTSYAPLSGSSGPFTISFWFRSGDTTPTQSYLLEGYQNGQWSVIYGYNPQQIEFYTGDAAARQNSGITITDTAWHHVAYRKNGSGISSWDKFLDGVKTSISPSIAFFLPAVSSYFAFNADNGLAPCVCSLADVAVYDSALSDAQVQALAGGNHPTPGSDLLLYWPLTGTSNPEQDASGNNHPGTVFGNIVQVPGPAFTGAPPPPPTGAGVLTAQYDTSRTNSNPNETSLNTTNVNVSQFGKLFSLSVDGYVYAQPLYVGASVIPELGHNTVFIATMHNTVYAFDADSGAALWSLNLGPSQTVAMGFLGPETGILSTPVIDVGRKTLYVVARNTDGFRLHAIDLVAHTEKAGSPVLISGSVHGNGYDNVSGVITFFAGYQLQRPGLLLANSTIYIGFGSIEDSDPWHGWLFAYNADTLSQTSIFCVTPNGGRGAIWMGGGAPAADSSGNIYVVTANGDWDGSSNFGDSFLKLSPSLSIVDWFTPANQGILASDDADLGSTRAMLLPSLSRLMGGGKDGALWLLNSTTGQMGHLQGTPGNPSVVQTFQATTDLVTSGIETNGLWDGMAYWGAAPGGPMLYIHGSDDVLKAFRLQGSTFNTTPVAQSSTTRPFPGGVLAISSNGSSGGVLWATTPDSATNNGPSTGVLRAFDPITLTELWNSNQNAARDALGMFAKFVAPTVVNGRVYTATFSNQVVVYGLLP